MTSRTAARVLLPLALVALIAVVIAAASASRASAGAADRWISSPTTSTPTSAAATPCPSPTSTRTASWTSSPTRWRCRSSPGTRTRRGQRHVIVPETQQIVNQAMADIDGDGIPEIAFQSSFAMQAANSAGINWIARHNGDPRQPWKVEKIDAFPTSHHVAWADLDGDGKKELINAPLIGEKSVAPTYDQDKASVFWYSPKDWKRHVVTADIPGIIHRVRPVTWDEGKREQFLVASFEGIALYRASGSGDAMTFEKAAALGRPRREGAAPRRERRRRRQAGRQALLRLGRAVARQRGRRLHRDGRQVGSPRHLRQGLERPRDRRRRSERRRPRRCGGERQQPGQRPEPQRRRRACTCSSRPRTRRPASGSTGGSRTRRR